MSDLNAEIKVAIDSFDMDRARELLRDALKDPDAETYYLASKAAIDEEQKQEFLEKAIEVDPFHEKARKAMITSSKQRDYHDQHPTGDSFAVSPTPAVSGGKQTQEIRDLELQLSEAKKKTDLSDFGNKAAIIGAMVGAGALGLSRDQADLFLFLMFVAVVVVFGGLFFANVMNKAEDIKRLEGYIEETKREEN